MCTKNPASAWSRKLEFGKENCCLAHDNHRTRRERCPQRSVRKFDLDGEIFCIFSYYGVINVALRARNAEDSVPYRALINNNLLQ